MGQSTLALSIDRCQDDRGKFGEDEDCVMETSGSNTKPKRNKRMSQAERTALSDMRMHNAAIDLILEHGTHHMTLQEVGMRAGYSRGLASNRFGSKEALFTELVSDFNARWKVELSKRVGRKTGLMAFIAGSETVEFFITTESREARAMYILWYESITSYPEVRAHHADHHHVLRRDAEKWIREGIDKGEIRDNIDPAGFGVQFCSFLFGVVYQWLVEPEMIDLHSAFSDYRRMTLDTIAKPRVSLGTNEEIPIR